MDSQKSVEPNQILRLDFSKYLHDRKILMLVGAVLLCVVLTTVVIGIVANQSRYEAIPPTAEYVPQELLLQYEEGYAPHELSESKLQILTEQLERLGVVSQEKVYQATEGDISRYYLLTFQEGVDIGALQTALRDVPGTKVSEPNFIMHPNAIPDDPNYNQLWGMQRINASTAWDATTGSNSIVVGVIDTGIDASHPDLAQQIVGQYNGIDGSSSAFDDVGHGTHVAGTIGAVGNNAIGVTGVNWTVKMLIVKVCSQSGCPATAITRGLEYAANNGAQVVNMSLGTRAPHQDTCSSNSAASQMIQYARSRGVTVVVAAGNDTRDASVVSPASCEGVITVGATGPSDERSGYTNYGAKVEIAAPGGNSASSSNCGASNCILSTWPGGYRAIQGTSMAAPHVAGAAALLLSANSSLSPDQISSCLVQNADAISSSGIGPRLNIANAISSCSTIVGDPTSTPDPIDPPTPTTSNIRYYIDGFVYRDLNNNGEFDQGVDTGVVNTNLALSGALASSATTLADGSFLFDGLIPGSYTVTHNATASPPISLGPTLPNVTVTFRIVQDGANLTPTVVPEPIVTPTPTSTVVQPTVTPVQSTATQPPVPTSPPVYYRCEYDPSCATGQKNIQLCPLVCTQR